MSALKPGDVFRFITDQAIGHARREKLHVFLAVTDSHRAPADHAFILISSLNYGSCFPLLQRDYPAFLSHDSFISCSALVFYDRAHLASTSPRRCGAIRKDHLIALRHHLSDHEVLTQWEITLACKALPAL